MYMDMRIWNKSKNFYFFVVRLIINKHFRCDIIVMHLYVIKGFKYTITIQGSIAY